MKTLKPTDYVLCNKEMTEIFRFADTHEIVIYGNIQEAIEDLDEDEIVVSCTSLPQILQLELLKQINE